MCEACDAAERKEQEASWIEMVEYWKERALKAEKNARLFAHGDSEGENQKK